MRTTPFDPPRPALPTPPGSLADGFATSESSPIQNANSRIRVFNYVFDMGTNWNGSAVPTTESYAAAGNCIDVYCVSVFSANGYYPWPSGLMLALTEPVQRTDPGAFLTGNVRSFSLEVGKQVPLAVSSGNVGHASLVCPPGVMYQLRGLSFSNIALQWPNNDSGSAGERFTVELHVWNDPAENRGFRLGTSGNPMQTASPYLGLAGVANAPFVGPVAPNPTPSLPILFGGTRRRR